MEGQQDLLVPSCNVIDAPLGIVLVSFAVDVVVHGGDHLQAHQLMLYIQYSYVGYLSAQLTQGCIEWECCFTSNS